MRHPITILVDRIGTLSTMIVLGVIVVVTVEVTPEGSIVSAAVLGLAVLAAVTSSRVLDGSERTELDVAADLYVDGEIPLDEFERRAELILDDRAAEIRETVEQVGGVGPVTSSSIAIEFESVDDVSTATVDELRDVHGVGPSTAEAIRDYFGVDAARSHSSSSEASVATDGGGRPWE